MLYTLIISVSPLALMIPRTRLFFFFRGNYGNMTFWDECTSDFSRLQTYLIAFVRDELLGNKNIEILFDW